MQIGINPTRLASITLLGAKYKPGQGLCATEAVAYIAEEPHSDQPECVCPVICAFVRNWNDQLPDEDRTRLLLPLVPKLVGTRSTKVVERRRSLLAADWLVRVNTPTWLRSAGLDLYADTLSNLPEITSADQVTSIGPTINDALKDAHTLAENAWAYRGAEAPESGGWPAWDAATLEHSQPGLRDRDGGILDVVFDAGWCAASYARAVKIDLKPTVTELQASALTLIERMIDVRESA